MKKLYALGAALALTLTLAITPPASAAPHVKIGTTLYFSYSKTKNYSMVLEKIVDPATVEPGAQVPAGTRYVGAMFKIVNTGKKPIDFSLFQNTYAVESSGETLDPASATFAGKDCPPLSDGIATPLPGSFVVGCVLFTVPKKQHLTKIEFGSGALSVWTI